MGSFCIVGDTLIEALEMRGLMILLTAHLCISSTMQQEPPENTTEGSAEEESEEEGLPSSDVNLVAFYLYPSVE